MIITFHIAKRTGGFRMNKITEEVSEHHGVKLHLVPSKKYKTMNIVVKFKAPLTRETITERALLPYILRQGRRARLVIVSRVKGALNLTTIFIVLYFLLGTK